MAPRQNGLTFSPDLPRVLYRSSDIVGFSLLLQLLCCLFARMQVPAEKRVLLTCDLMVFSMVFPR
ncbi:MAG: hypothetical protein CME89_12820 [Hirschia sp.]|nr:hypothetical protein [Hirschia sp.]